jgi:hypothetical protein
MPRSRRSKKARPISARSDPDRDPSIQSNPDRKQNFILAHSKERIKEGAKIHEVEFLFPPCTEPPDSETYSRAAGISGGQN